MEIKDVITISIATIGLILSLINFYSNKFNIKNEFFKTAISQEMIQARHYVRTTDELSMDNKYVVELLNFYNYWGTMVKQKHLPLSTFYSASGFNVIELFEKLKPLIDKERDQRNNIFYARDFEKLYDILKKKYDFKH